jgi:ribosomal-protein-alanine N-acetyltransferase
MQTERTIIKTLTEEGYGEILRMYDEPDTFKYIPMLQNKSRDKYIDFLDSRIEQIDSGAGYHWTVWLKENKSFVGMMNLNPISNSDKTQIGFQIRHRYWQQGFATELTKKIIQFGISEAQKKEIYGFFSKDNIASAKIFQNLGFKFKETKKVGANDAAIEIWRYTAPLSV